MAVMARLVMQCGLHAEWLDDSFERGEEQDCEATREQLFSMTAKAMVAIATPAQRTHHLPAGTSTEFGALVTSLHDRMSRLQSGWSRGLVKESAALLVPAALPRADQSPSTVTGYRLRVLDGRRMPLGMQCTPGPEGCTHVVAGNDAGRDVTPQPRMLPVYDPDLGMIVDLVPCERGHIHERAFLGAYLESLQPGDLWIVDGRFNTNAILSGWPRRGSAFIVQEHGCAAAYRELDAPRETGQLDDAPVFEQTVGIDDGCGASLVFRRIEWRRSGVNSANDADATIRILTNVPASHLDALQIVRLSCRRWSDSLPLPMDALFDCAMAAAVPSRAMPLASSIVAVAYNVLSVMLGAVRSTLALDAHDLEGLPLHISTGIEAAYGGMMIALPPENWRRYDQLPAAELGQIVRRLAVHIDPRSERRRRQENKLSAKSQARLRAGTVERLLHGDMELDALGPFRLPTIAMATRDFSSNPSKALRHAGEALVMVTKYNRPIGLLVSIDNWNRLLGEVRESSLDRLSLDYAAFAQMTGPAAFSEPSLN
ncbi:type II toxin-antitoxin system Phd/YefM family antitoxin [Paraburkholderia megapolitana]|uniref:Uncharacterized protein n=2 Tax=Paraburkholderia megapolitana TaxID=420953 RepID=A0A1I3DF13_9BURK|nr:type II toxin-antitoxin system Phd/YefM family antitoxin [Paraburkholderia megapolitana]SFH85370.1 hypothetical protein SAMN05192543_101275 [Paraburkholderia megapolitana]